MYRRLRATASLKYVDGDSHHVEISIPSLKKRRPYMVQKKQSPIHPGEVLEQEFLVPLSISQYRLAKDISVPARRINEIVLGKRGITADTALRLARYFGTTDRFWLNLQARCDLEVERDRLGARLEKEVAVFDQQSVTG